MAGSPAQLRRLGAELRRLREVAGRTQEDVGKAIGRTHASLVNWERGKTKISRSDLARLLAELRVPTELRKGLEQLHAEAGKGVTQWAVYGLPHWLRPLLSFEEDAICEVAFEPSLIPGLLQTEEYASAMHAVGRHKVAPEFAERWVAARMHRQRLLTGPSSLRLHVIIGEAALRLVVGSRDVLAGQLERLLEAARADNITIQVLAAVDGGYAGVANNFTVLRFADPRLDPPLGYFDTALGGGFMISDEGDVATLISLFEDLRFAALPESASVKMVTTILEEHRREGSKRA